MFKERTQWYDYILDIIDTKLYKPTEEVKIKKIPNNICVIPFVNKGLDDINIQKIIKDKETIKSLPEKLRTREHTPLISYKLGPTIRNKIFNYKETIENIEVDHNNQIQLERCDCKNSKFLDQNIGHIITGDLRIIENNKLRKLLSKGPKYREPYKKNYKKCKEVINNALNDCINNMGDKYKINKIDFKSWKQIIMEKVNNKIKKCKKTKYQPHVDKILNDPNIKEYLSTIHNKYVLVPIDKASNNIAFICKSFYIERTLKEAGVLGKTNPTYKITNKHPEEIVLNNHETCKSLKISVDKYNTLPIMYWIPKMHKNPTGMRFIIASSNSSNKPLSIIVSNVFKMIFRQIGNFHHKSKFYNNYNLFWVIQNSKSVIETLDRINKHGKAKSIATYDFSTLYTKIEHTDLIEKLNEIIDLAYDGGKCKYIMVKNNKIQWVKTKEKENCTYFNKETFKKTVEYLITEYFFKIGNVTLLQTIGIPMGTNPAPFFANLYLHRYEYKYMLDKIKNNTKDAIKYNDCYRFIDDLLAINDHGLFDVEHVNIYPEQLLLQREHHGITATFLDLEINIKNGKFIYKMFDKRDNFPFKIIRLPFVSSNIPKKIFYSTILAEFLRIARNTLQNEDLIHKTTELISRVRNQGGNDILIKRQLRKAMAKYPEVFNKYSIRQEKLIYILCKNKN